MFNFIIIYNYAYACLSITQLLWGVGGSGPLTRLSKPAGWLWLLRPKSVRNRWLIESLGFALLANMNTPSILLVQVIDGFAAQSLREQVNFNSLKRTVRADSYQMPNMYTVPWVYVHVYNVYIMQSSPQNVVLNILSQILKETRK